MGGGPASADVVRSSCLLTFPAETNVEPVPVDAWYLHAVGLKFLRRLVKDRVADPKLHLALVLQQDGDPPRFLSIGNDAVLKQALEQAFQEQSRVVLLHVVALTRVQGQKTIHVRVAENPNVSPEPIAPMDFVMPVLPIAGVVSEEEVEQNVEQAVPLAVPCADKSGAPITSYQEQEQEQKQAEQDEVQPWKSSSTLLGKNDAYWPTLASSSYLPAARSMHASDFSIAGAAMLGADALESTAIPLARVVGANEDGTNNDMATTEAATPAPTDFVMLELQHGAGLEPMAANASSTFFISPNWYHATEDADPRMLSNSIHTSATASASASSSAATSSAESSLADSFVVLDHADSATPSLL